MPLPLIFFYAPPSYTIHLLQKIRVGHPIASQQKIHEHIRIFHLLGLLGKKPTCTSLPFPHSATFPKEVLCMGMEGEQEISHAMKQLDVVSECLGIPYSGLRSLEYLSVAVLLTTKLVKGNSVINSPQFCALVSTSKQYTLHQCTLLTCFHGWQKRMKRCNCNMRQWIELRMP